ncbi:hypothetical protein Poly30_10980 [Planctomycetes bacterium Poly30]|uniref:Outer membrane protein beta-barrel domain-containing protein n=1 Tax=Saltatorellus ferox TaxID=2528018 RepID=A0A518END8_9BACT|nr:hypothetical protein Poly30_10980 [Planctomycetes bacterium Poly30]
MLLIAAAALMAAPQLGDGTQPARFTLPNTFGEAGSGSVEVQLGFYQRDDPQGAGNPFLDEKLTVIEPIVVFDYNVSDTFSYSGLFVYDYVSSASIERLSRFPQQSGASGDYYVGFDLGARWKTSDQTFIGARTGFSTEYDYQSIHLGGDYGWERSDKDAKLTLSVDAFLDTVKPIRWDGTTDPDDDRTSLAATASWFQILGPKTQGTFGVTVSSQTGFLETPYNSVIVDNGTGVPNNDLFNNAPGFEVQEELPDSRLRTVAFSRVRHLLSPGNAVELGARIYSDDWGIGAFDLMPRYIKSFDGGRNLLELRYRFYTQSAADYFQSEIVTGPVPDERTMDFGLGEFSSHTLGGTWQWNNTDSTRWTFSLDYSIRDDDLRTYYGLVGYRWTF